MMDSVVELARQIPVVRDVDVLVVGGGPAGLIAATAAARHGAGTLLVERYGCLGGLATGGLVLYMDALADRSGQRTIGGLPWEVLERLKLLNGLAEDGPLALHADSELLKVVADNVCIEAGVELRLHSWAVAALMDGTTVQGIIVESKSGRQAIRCRVCIDATGDGDVAALAGAAFDLNHQCIGLNLKVGGIDRQRYQEFVQKHPLELREMTAQVRSLGGYSLWPNTTPYSEVGDYWLNILGLASRRTQGVESDDVLERFAGRLSAVNVEDLTYAEVELRRQIMLSLDFYRRNVPGYEGVRLLSFASQLGVRDSRRVKGVHQLTKDEMISNAAPVDSIGRAGAGFCPAHHYQVSYGCLVPQTIDGLLTSGRCISADSYAQQAVRLIPPAMMTGQAAGTAAAWAVQHHCTPRDVDVEQLRQHLLADAVIL